MRIIYEKLQNGVSISDTFRRTPEIFCWEAQSVGSSHLPDSPSRCGTAPSPRQVRTQDSPAHADFMPNETNRDLECSYQRLSRRHSPNHTVCGGGWLVTRHGASDNNVAEGRPGAPFATPDQHPRRPSCLSSRLPDSLPRDAEISGRDENCPAALEHQRNFVCVMSSAIGSPIATAAGPVGIPTQASISSHCRNHLGTGVIFKSA